MSDVASLPQRPPWMIDASVRAAFAAMAKARGDRALHPLGRTHEAELEITADRARLPRVEVLQEPRSRRVLVRVSRGAGIPSPLPDAIGLAIRWPDRYGRGQHQDLLLTSSADLPLLNNLPVPRSRLAGAQLSSLLPYDVAGRRLLFGARVVSSADEIDRMRSSYRGLRIQVMLGTRFGRFHPIGELQLGEPLSPRVDAFMDFDPWNTAHDISPAGWWNRVRSAAYEGSRRGRRS